MFITDSNNLLSYRSIALVVIIIVIICMICGFCKRDKDLTFHHYIPRTLHSNKLFKKLFEKAYMKSHGIDLCKDCHKTVHEFWDEKTLGKEYNTKEKILSDDKFRKYLKWIIKQD